MTLWERRPVQYFLVALLAGSAVLGWASLYLPPFITLTQLAIRHPAAAFGSLLFYVALCVVKFNRRAHSTLKQTGEALEWLMVLLGMSGILLGLDVPLAILRIAYHHQGTATIVLITYVLIALAVFAAKESNRRAVP